MAISLEPRNAKFRLYVMPLAVGMYLPFSVTTPLLLSPGIISLVSLGALLFMTWMLLRKSIKS